MDASAIIALRNRLGMTQERLAEFLGVDRSTVSKMESGQKISGPCMRLLTQLDEESGGKLEQSARTSKQAARVPSTKSRAYGIPPKRRHA